MTRILIGGFRHETNTFSRLATDLTSYRARTLVYKEDVKRKFRGTRTEPAAFIEFCKSEGWQAITPIYGDASPGGKVTADTFNHFAESLCAAARDDGPFDAAMLSLHGSMVCEHAEDGEGVAADGRTAHCRWHARRLREAILRITRAQAVA